MAARHGLTIRSADPGDAEGLRTLFSLAGLAAPPRAMSARLEAALEGPGAVLIALEWGPPSGVIALSWSAVLTQDTKLATITLLLVDPEQRRRGVGRLLLKAAAQSARAAGCGDLLVTAPGGAAPLREFCAASGFAEEGPALVRPLRKHS